MQVLEEDEDLRSDLTYGQIGKTRLNISVRTVPIQYRTLDPFSIGWGLLIATEAAIATNLYVPRHEKWHDKWAHGFVGCRMRRVFVSRDVAFFIASGWEVFQEAIGHLPWFKMKFSLEDILATMWGYDHALDFNRWYIRWFLGFIPIFVPVIYTCKAVCDKFAYKWEEFRQLENSRSIIQKLVPRDFIKEASNSLFQVYEDTKDSDPEVIKERMKNVLNEVKIKDFERPISKEEQKTILELKSSEAMADKKEIDQIYQNGYPNTPPIELKYLVNSNTNEIHDMQNLTPLCNLHLIKEENKMYIEKLNIAKKAIKYKFDGCKHCMPKYHKD